MVGPGSWSTSGQRKLLPHPRRPRLEDLQRSPWASRRTPRPPAEYEVNDKQKDPAWYPPDSPWAAELYTHPAGAGEPARDPVDRARPAPAIGIHGTSRTARSARRPATAACGCTSPTSRSSSTRSRSGCRSPIRQSRARRTRRGHRRRLGCPGAQRRRPVLCQLLGPLVRDPASRWSRWCATSRTASAAAGGGRTSTSTTTPARAGRYDVLSLPTLILFTGGQPVERIAGSVEGGAAGAPPSPPTSPLRTDMPAIYFGLGTR